MKITVAVSTIYNESNIGQMRDAHYFRVQEKKNELSKVYSSVTELETKRVYIQGENYFITNIQVSV